MKTKICKTCNHLFTLDNFYSSNSYKDRIYYSASCKDCTRSKNKVKYKEKIIPAVLENPKIRLLQLAKARSIKKGLEFNIDESDIKLPELCPILNIPLKVSTDGLSQNSYSIDRIDSTLGYVKGNVQVISHLANTMKSTADKTLLLNFAKWVLENF